MSPSDEEIDRIAAKLRDAFYNDLTDCPILNDGAEALLALKARVEAAETQVDCYKLDIKRWREAEVRAEAAENERDMLKAALERRGEIVFGKEGD